MSIAVQWDDSAKTVLRVTLEDGWGADDLYALIDRACDLSASVNHAFDILADVGATAPVGVNLFRIAQHLLLSRLPINLNRIIVVTQNSMIRILNRSLVRVHGQFRGVLITVGSLEHADAVLRAYHYRDVGTMV